MKNISKIKTTYSIPAIIESLLFVATMPISINQMAKILNETPKEIKVALNELDAHYEKWHGLRLQRNGKKIQLVTAPDLSQLIEKFLGIETTTKLSQASLETLAIIAFRQPVTRPTIEGIRGVNSDGVVRNLLSKGLIEEIGRKEGIGRPILYGTTADFLNYFGLSSLDDLPPFVPLEEMQNEKAKILKD